MSSLAKIGPDQKSLKNSGRIWPTKLVIWLAVETPEVKNDIVIARSSREILETNPP